MIEIKLLGTGGCNSCSIIYQNTKSVIDELGINANIIEINNILEIMNYNVLKSPAIIINNIVKIKGRVPSKPEIKELLLESILNSN